ncbi:MAG: hypothetical protein KA010_03195 [Saprospiraceae bacterium]|nr:hypothetical protein [Saprospiraceae bacterium]
MTNKKEERNHEFAPLSFINTIQMTPKNYSRRNYNGDSSANHPTYS